jgi:hypothetical protein
MALVLDGLVKRFGAITALDGLSFAPSGAPSAPADPAPALAGNSLARLIPVGLPPPSATDF